MQKQKVNSRIDASVIFLSYNQPETLKLALGSFLAQDFQGSFEVLICDDGSRAGLFSEFREDFNNAKIPIKYIWQQHREFRASASRNNGIKMAKGELLIFLDGDMVPGLDFISKHVKSHDRPKMLVAGNRCWRDLREVEDKINKLSIVDFLGYLKTHKPSDPKIRERACKEKEYRIKWSRQPHPWRVCFSCNLSVQWAPEVFFDENFIGWGPDDWEFAHRLWKNHNYKPVYKKEIAAYHLETPESAGNIFRRGQHNEIVNYLRNTYYLFDRIPNLDLEDVFHAFPKLFLNSKTNQWEIRPRPVSYDLAKIVKGVRQWLWQNNIYPQITYLDTREIESESLEYTNDIEGWMLKEELNWLYLTAQRMKNIVEIGSWKGKSTHALLSGCKGTVWAIDHFKGSETEKDAAHRGAMGADIYDEFLENVGQFKNLRVLRMSSGEAAEKFKNKSVDMVFIDAGHTYKEVMADIEAWLPKTRKLICGHDYNWQGVRQAVDDRLESVETFQTIWIKYLEK